MVKKYNNNNNEIKNSYSDSLRIHAVTEQVKTISEVRNLILKSYIKISVPVPGVLTQGYSCWGMRQNTYPNLYDFIVYVGKTVPPK